VIAVAEILSSTLVIKSSEGKVWKLDRETHSVTLYANETQYDADSSIGSLPLSEFIEVYDFAKASLET
jgi:hypothetical protein